MQIEPLGIRNVRSTLSVHSYWYCSRKFSSLSSAAPYHDCLPLLVTVVVKTYLFSEAQPVRSCR